MRIGFIGLGDQGGRMAQRIAEDGFATTVWARRPATLEPFARVPFTIAGSPAEVGAASDVACICVVDDAGVLDVADGLLDGMAAGGVIVVHSTVHPDTCHELARRAAVRGIAVVDAPVSGGGAMALERKLLVMAGGTAEDVDRCRPVFATYGDPVLHLGPLGAGQAAKLLNNLIFTAHLALATDIFALGRELGVDPGSLAEVLTHGSGRSYGVQVTAGIGHSAAPLGPQAGALLQKDVGIVADLAHRLGAPTGVLVGTADAMLARFGLPRTGPEPDGSDAETADGAA